MVLQEASPKHLIQGVDPLCPSYKLCAISISGERLVEFEVTSSFTADHLIFELERALTTSRNLFDVVVGTLPLEANTPLANFVDDTGTVTVTVIQRKPKVRVVARIRNRDVHEQEQASDLPVSLVGSNKLIVTQKGEVQQTEFGLEHVFCSPLHSSVFEGLKAVALHVCDGGNACIFSHGSVYTSKSATITGSESNPGLYELFVKELLSINSDSDSNRSVTVSFVGIIHEQVFDLLDDTRPRTNLRLRSSETKSVFFEPELKELTLHSSDGAVEVLKQARNEINSYYNDTGWLPRYSTMVIQFKVEQPDLTKPGNLYLVDLMCSDCVGRAGIGFETTMPNKVFASLRNVLTKLDTDAFVPFRDSKLTFMLKPALIDNPEIILLLHVSQDEANLDETLSSLRYGAGIKGSMVVQKNMLGEST
jgi:hypothetical protein